MVVPPPLAQSSDDHPEFLQAAERGGLPRANGPNEPAQAAVAAKDFDEERVRLPPLEAVAHRNEAHFTVAA